MTIYLVIYCKLMYFRMLCETIGKLFFFMSRKPLFRFATSPLSSTGSEGAIILISLVRFHLLVGFSPPAGGVPEGRGGFSAENV